MPANHDTVTVTNSATLIISANSRRKRIYIVNNSDSVTIYLGSSASVTSSNGLPLYPNQAIHNEFISEGYAGDIYGITSASTADVRYWEEV